MTFYTLFFFQIKVPEQIDGKIFDRPENSTYFNAFKDVLDKSHVDNESVR